MTEEQFAKLLEYIDMRCKSIALEVDGRGMAHEYYASESPKNELKVLLVDWRQNETPIS